MKTNIPKWIRHIIISMGNCTFGIYLIHVLVLTHQHTNYLLTWLIRNKINSLLAILLVCSFVMITSYGIIWLLKKIPIIKRIL